MSEHFGSLAEFAEHLIEVEIGMREALEQGLQRVAALVERTAKSEIGIYQPETGGFPEWPELADSTKDERARLGFSENDPLLRTGELRDSIERQVEGLEAQIGSADERMAFHEFGTSKMPARPVLGPAAFRNKEVIQKLVGAAVVSGLIGADQIHSALGYDFSTKD